jgi:hypothetical protein
MHGLAGSHSGMSAMPSGTKASVSGASTAAHDGFLTGHVMAALSTPQHADAMTAGNALLPFHPRGASMSDLCLAVLVAVSLLLIGWISSRLRTQGLVAQPALQIAQYRSTSPRHPPDLRRLCISRT